MTRPLLLALSTSLLAIATISALAPSPAHAAPQSQKKKQHEYDPKLPYAAQREKTHDDFRRLVIETLGEIGAGATSAIEALEALREEEAMTEAVDAALARIKAHPAAD